MITWTVSLVFGMFVLMYGPGAGYGIELSSDDVFLLAYPRDMTLEVSSVAVVNVTYRGTIGYPVIVYFSFDDKRISDFVTIKEQNCTLLPESDIPCSFHVSASRAHQNVLLIPNCSTEYCPFKSLDQSFVRINVVQSHFLTIITTVIGWIYFVAWSTSFYPQIYENCKRKSVAGLDFNFIILNFTGFVCYSVFNCAFYFSKDIQRNYFEKNPFGLIPVHPNDIFFGLHALLATFIVIIQCCVFKGAPGQRVSIVCLALLTFFVLFVLFSLLLVLCSKISWLLFIQFVSYIKLLITLLKYIPQAYYNYNRKSTEGWSIGNIFLDLIGGSFSLLQLFLDAYNCDDFKSVFEDVTKFGLGVISLCFDAVFILQHYVLYRYPRLRRSDSIYPIVSSESQYNSVDDDHGTV